MSEATADIVAKTDEQVTVTFTPNQNGFASLAGASLRDAANKEIKKWEGQNAIQFSAPKGDATLTLAYLDGPDPETWDLCFTVTGTTTHLGPGLSFVTSPAALTVFGK